MTEQYMEKKVAVLQLQEYERQMKQEELGRRTISKYLKDVQQWLAASEEEITKEGLICYKETMQQTYKASSLNSKIISINRYLRYLGYADLVLKTDRIQQANSLENVISKEQYERMLLYAKCHNKKKTYYIMKTIAQTGIRVSELEYITLEAVKEGTVVVKNKGKFRTIYLTEKLCEKLLDYCEENAIQSGVIFCGREKGKMITPEAVWKNLKYIAKKAGVPEKVVYPHSFRHLFAKEYMRIYSDMFELADILGHSRLETTRIYTKSTSLEKRMRMSNMQL